MGLSLLPIFLSCSTHRPTWYTAGAELAEKVLGGGIFLESSSILSQDKDKGA